MGLSSKSTSNETALEGMHHCLESIMCSKLLVDVVKMIPKRLRADTKRFGNSRGRDTHCKHLEDFKLLRGERRNRRSSGDGVFQIGHFFRNGDHAAENLFPLLLRTDVTNKMNEKRPAGPPVQKRNGRKIDPYPLLAPGSHIQIEIWYGTRRFGTSQYSATFTDVRTQSPYSVQDIGAGPPEHLLRWVAKEIFCCVIPETDFARHSNGKNRIRCIFEKGEQLRFEHI